MISLNKENQAIIKYKGKEYCLKKSEEYQKFVILITDPKISIDKDIFEIDSSIRDPKWISIFTKYKDFFESFLNAKSEIIKAAEQEVEDQLPKTSTS